MIVKKCGIALFLFFMSVYFLSSSLYAQAQLDSPSDILQRLETKGENDILTRMDVLDEVFAIQPHVRTMPRREMTESYLLFVDDLLALTEKYELDLSTLGTKAIQDLGRSLSKHILRWLNLGTDRTETVLSFHKWADFPAAYEHLSLFQYQLARLRAETTDPDAREGVLVKLKNAAQNLSALLQWAQNISDPSAPDYLLHGYQNVRSDVALLAFRIKNPPSSEDIAFWAEHVTRNEGYQKIFTHLQRSIHLTKPEDVDNLHSYAALLFRLRQKISEEIELIDDYAQDMQMDVARNLIVKMLYLDEPFEEGEFEHLLQDLLPDHLTFLTYKWIRKPFLTDNQYGIHLLEKAHTFLERLKAFHMSNEIEDFKHYYRTRGAAYFAKQLDVEGSYVVETQEADERQRRRYRITLAFAKDDMLIASAFLLAENSDINFSYYHVVYDLEEKAFYASERPPDFYGIPNWGIRFSVKDQTLSGVFFNTINHELGFVGQKTIPNRFQDYFGMAVDDAESIVGTYVGEMGSGESRIPLKLHISQFNETLNGRLIFGDNDFFVQLGIGTKGLHRGIVYLTAGINSTRDNTDNKNANWVQFRAVLRGNELHGQYISGMRGIVDDSVRLVRQ